MRLEDIDPYNTISFHGYTVPWGKDEESLFKTFGALDLYNEDDIKAFGRMLSIEIELAVLGGYNTFLATLESIFEIVAFELLHTYQQNHFKDIKLIYVTLDGQYGKPRYYHFNGWLERFYSAIEFCDDFIEVVKPEKFRESIDACKWYMKEYSDMQFRCIPDSLCIADDEGIITIKIPNVTEKEYTKRLNRPIPSCLLINPYIDPQ